MKKIILIFSVHLILQSCNKEDAIVCDVNQKVATSLKDVEDNLVGEWKLTDYFAFRAEQIDPNIQLQFTKNKENDKYAAIVFEDNKKIGSTIITVEEGVDFDIQKQVTLTSDRSIIFANSRYNFLFGNLRICEDQLLIDNGMAFDAPGFLFEKE